MLLYDKNAPTKSWIKLVVCLAICCSGTAGAVYFLLKVYWVAGVVIAIPVWIFLVDLLINRKRSITWYLLDFLRFLLIFSGTAAITLYLWKVNWVIGAISILPVFFLLLNVIGFLTLRVYDITPEARATRKMFKRFEHSNSEVLEK